MLDKILLKKTTDVSTQNQKSIGSINLIAIETEISGNFICLGDVRIDGKINGEVNTKAKLVLGQSAEVLGNVFAQNAEVSGKVFGDIIVKDVLFLRESAVIKGDITAQKIIIEGGAMFEGYCNVGTFYSDTQKETHVESRQEQKRNKATAFS